MNEALSLLAACLISYVVWRTWHKLGDPEQKPEQQTYAEAVAQKRVRDKRLKLLRKAYALAKDELGEEPSVEQIILTRDQLLLQEELDTSWLD